MNHRDWAERVIWLPVKGFEDLGRLEEIFAEHERHILTEERIRIEWALKRLEHDQS